MNYVLTCTLQYTFHAIPLQETPFSAILACIGEQNMLPRYPPGLALNCNTVAGKWQITCLLRSQRVKDSRKSTQLYRNLKVLLRERNIPNRDKSNGSLNFETLISIPFCPIRQKKALVQKGNSVHIYHDICPCKLYDCCFWGRKIEQYRLEIGNDNLYYNVRGSALYFPTGRYAWTLWEESRLLMIQDIFQDE